MKRISYKSLLTKFLNRELFWIADRELRLTDDENEVLNKITRRLERRKKREERNKRKQVTACGD